MNNEALMDHILSELRGFYPHSKNANDVVVAEIVNEMTMRGWGEIEFNEALAAYRRSEKGQYCPTWIDLRKPQFWNRKPDNIFRPRRPFGLVMVRNASDYARLGELYRKGRHLDFLYALKQLATSQEEISAVERCISWAEQKKAARMERAERQQRGNLRRSPRGLWAPTCRQAAG